MRLAGWRDRAMLNRYAASTADDHAEAVGRWASSVWAAWSAHHATVAALTDRLSPRLR